MDANVWISVKERLPQELEEVLVIADGIRSIAYIAPSQISGSGYYQWFRQGGMALRAKVTHWQPLPPAPEGER